VGNYLILYRVSEDEVEIVRYVHGRRNLSGIV
jgi:plasmid stabilization system protein ParE